MKLNKDIIQKIVLGLVGYAIVFTIFNNYILKQINVESEKRKAQLLTEKTLYETNLGKSNTLEEKKKEWIERTRIYNNKTASFIYEKNKKAMLNELEERAQKREIRLESVSTMVNETSPEEGDVAVEQYDEFGNPIPQETVVKYKEFIVVMKIKSNFVNITRYIDELEKMKKMVSITSIEMKKEETDIGVVMTLKSYIIPEEGEIKGNGQETGK